MANARKQYSANLLHDTKGVGKQFIATSFACHCVLFYTVFFIPSTTIAKGTETTHITESYSNNNEKGASYTDAILEEEFAAECLWLACDQTIALATRQETPLIKTPGIVTVITDEEIKKIEIIRCPGSAMYGENAFRATINIITKDARDIDGVKISSGFGSFDTYDENIMFGTTYGKMHISGMANYRQTSGFDGVVKSDSVTRIDNALSPFGFTAASQAPGKVDGWRQEFDVNLKIGYKDFYAEGLYINKNRGPFIAAC